MPSRAPPEPGGSGVGGLGTHPGRLHSACSGRGSATLRRGGVRRLSGVCVLVCVCVCVFGWGNPACGMALRASRTDYFPACQLGMALRTSWNVDLKILLRSGPSDLPVL